MKKLIMISMVSCFFMTGCQRTSSQTWENVKTAGNYLNRGIDALWGKVNDSRLIEDESQFAGPVDAEFIPLNEADLTSKYKATDMAVKQPAKSIGEKGCPVKGIGDFKSPEGQLAQLFKNLHFDTDDHVIRDREGLVTLHKIATYMKKNPTVYLTVEGHCDERASAAYNMALGARRANHVRVLLIKQGVDFNRIYTISHGKEKPLAMGSTPDDWKANRRTEFKIFIR